jgi:hypothetical protein
MNFLHRVTQGLKAKAKAFGLILVSLMLPAHGKKLIFIGSLYCYVARLDALGDEALEKLNTALSLAKHGSALRLPAAAREVVWGDANVREVLNMDMLEHEVSLREAQQIAEKVVEMSPRWVRYRNRKAMIADVRELICGATGLSGEQLRAA